MVAPSTATQRTRARRGDGARLREEILVAATGLLSETGDEAAVSIRAVAQRVGVTPPSIYLHFGDKDELIFECARALMGQLQAEVLQALDHLTDPVGRLRAAAHAYVCFGIANPEPYRIMFMSPHRDIPGDLDLRDYEGMAAFEVLTEMINQARPVGVNGSAVRTAETDLVAMGLWAACHGITALMIAKAVEPIDFPWPSVDQLVDHVVDVHLSSLGLREGHR